jgi:Rab-like protein 3
VYQPYLRVFLICCSYSIGIILVHDLTNRKSEQNLQKWLAEVLSKDGTSQSRSSGFDDFDPEQFVGSTQVIRMYTCHSLLQDAIKLICLGWIWLLRTGQMLQISIKTWGNDQHIL